MITIAAGTRRIDDEIKVLSDAPDLKELGNIKPHGPIAFALVLQTVNIEVITTTVLMLGWRGRRCWGE